MVHTLLSILLDLLWVLLMCDMFQANVYALASLYEAKSLPDIKHLGERSTTVVNA